MTTVVRQGHTPDVKVDGTDVPATELAALMSVSVEMRRSAPARCTLRFTDESYALADGSRYAVGAQVKISTYDHDSKKTVVLFEGDVVARESERFGAEPASYVVTAYDAAYRLVFATLTKSYRSVAASDVITTIAQEAGLTAQVTSSAIVHDELYLPGRAIDALDGLCQREGWDWRCEAKKLVVGPPELGEAAVTLSADQLGYLSVRHSASVPTEVEVRGWDNTTQTAIVGTASTPAATGTNGISGDVRGTGWMTRRQFSTVHGLRSTNEATKVAQAMLDRASSENLVAVGECSANPELHPGVTVALTDVGTANSGTYLVTEVEHTYDPDHGFGTRFTAGPRTERGLGDLGGGVDDAGLAAFNRDGLRVAQVTNIADPDQRGRVKVRYVGVDDQVESWWARVLMAGAGDQRGAAFIPEVGDEVLVGFEGGDIRFPVVLGGLYGAKSKIPEWFVKGGKVTARQITSRAGHVIEIADDDHADPDNISLRVKGPKGVASVRLGADRYDVKVPQGIPLALTSGQSSLTFDDQGNLTIKAVKITLDANSEVAIKGKMAVGVEAGIGLTLEGKTSAQLKGGMVTAQATGVATVKGATVMIN